MVIGIDASRANQTARTGTEVYSYEIIKRLIRLYPQHQFVLYLKDTPLADLNNLGPNVSYQVLKWPPRILWNLVRLSLALVRHRPDVLFVPAHTIPIIHPPVTINALHDVGFERFYQLYSKKTIGGNVITKTLSLLIKLVTFGKYSATELDYHRWSARYAVRHASHIITISQFSKNEIVKYLKASPTKISVTYLARNPRLDGLITAKTKSAVLEKYGILQPYLFFVGRLEMKKNISRIVEAYFNVIKHKQYRSLQLVLAGLPGFGFAKVRSVIKAHPNDNQIKLTGWASETAVQTLMSQAAALVFPSLYEGFGLPLLDAFAHKTPVITSNENALTEIAGPAALQVDPHDTKDIAVGIIKVLADRRAAEELVANGTERLKIFDWDECAIATMKIIEREALKVAPRHQ